MPGNEKSLWDKTKELIEGRPMRKDLAKRESVSIGGKELRIGDHVYSRTTEGKLIEWDIKYWNEYGVVLQPSNAGSIKLKERLLGETDENLFEWGRLGMFTAEPGEE